MKELEKLWDSIIQSCAYLVPVSFRSDDIYALPDPPGEKITTNDLLDRCY